MADKTGKKGKKKANAKSIGPTAVLKTTEVVGKGVFAIMLDNLIRVHPRHFPITRQSLNIDDLHRVTQHNGHFVLIPRGTSDARLLENKDLINTITGAVDDGAIYKITVGGQ